MKANARSEREGNRRRKRKEIVEIMENGEKLRNEGVCRKLTWNGRRTEVTEAEKNRGEDCD